MKNADACCNGFSVSRKLTKIVRMSPVVVNWHNVWSLVFAIYDENN